METRQIRSLEEMDDFAEEVVRGLSPSSRAVVLALEGDLGSGKTTFTQALARVLGVSEHVTSPTFVIQKSYPLAGQNFETLVHVDAYRIDSTHELEVLGFGELLVRPKTLVCIEWPERAGTLIPETARRFVFTFVDDTTREVRYDTGIA